MTKTSTDCVLCKTWININERFGIGEPMHRECALRAVVGGIGHLVAHDYWCVQMNDPDAGLSYRQSALLTMQWVKIVGPPGEEVMANAE